MLLNYTGRNMIRRKSELDYQFINEKSMETFYTAISSIKTEDHSWLEAIVEYCERAGVEVDEVIDVIPDSIRAKLYMEALDNNMIKDSGPVLDL